MLVSPRSGHRDACSQGLAQAHVPDQAIDPAVTITLSGLTDMAIYSQQGYAYMQL